MGVDTKLVLENYVFPMSFPWYKPKAPLIRTVPRDIDDMPGLWFAGDVRMHGGEKGLLGFGAFDQGIHGYHQTRCVQGNLDDPEAMSDNGHSSDTYLGVRIMGPKIDIDHDNDAVIFAAARRSTDPGVVEISAMLPPPRSLESALLKYQTYGVLSNDPWLRNDVNDINRAKQIIDTDRKVASSIMPLYTNAIRGVKPIEPSLYFDNKIINRPENKLNIRRNDTVFFKEYERVNDEAQFTRDRTVRSMKRWCVSVKVGNVSSRSSLFSLTRHSMGSIDGRVALSSPLLCPASLPAISAQNGKHVSQAENKHDTFSGRPDMHTNGRTKKKDGENRTKDSYARRTKLIWSSSSLSCNGNNKLPYSDFLTGQKNDPKCPKDILAAVRLNGKLLSKPTSAKFGSNVNAGSKIRAPNTSTYYSPAKAIDVETSIRETYHKVISQTAYEPPINQTSRLECDNERTILDHAPLSHEKRQKLKSASVHCKAATLIAQDFVPMKHGGSHILKPVEPQISLITLSDYSSKILCEVAGRMQGSSVHTLLSTAARACGNVCCICWSGNDTFDIVECIECGLLVHLECCLDKGKVTAGSDSNDKKIWRCAVCFDTLSAFERKETDDCRSSQQLSCRKSSRLSKVPSRFVQDPAVAGTIDNQLYHKRLCKGRPSHKCTLCPHSGQMNIG